MPSCQGGLFRLVAQWIEHQASNLRVGGSVPPSRPYPFAAGATAAAENRCLGRSPSASLPRALSGWHNQNRGAAMVHRSNWDISHRSGCSGDHPCRGGDSRRSSARCKSRGGVGPHSQARPRLIFVDPGRCGAPPKPAIFRRGCRLGTVPHESRLVRSVGLISILFCAGSRPRRPALTAEAAAAPVVRTVDWPAAIAALPNAGAGAGGPMSPHRGAPAPRRLAPPGPPQRRHVAGSRA